MGCKPLRHVFPFQVEAAGGALYGLADGAMSVLAVDGIYGFHECFLTMAVYGVEEVLLTGIVW